jgi:predicted permease
LLVGAGLFIRSFIHLLDVDPGFNPKPTLAFDLSFPDAKYPKNEDRLRFIKNLNERIAGLPGVESVGSSSSLPFSRQGRSEQVSRMDKPARTDYVVACDFVNEGYFSAAGIRLVRGRVIHEADNQEQGSRVMVIDSRIAGELYPNEDPIGKQLRFLGRSWEIVGIVAPIRQYFLDMAPRQQIYVPQSFSPVASSMVIRTALPPFSLVDTVRRAILEADPDQPMDKVRTLENDIHRSLSSKRVMLILLDFFAVVAVSLACMGVYGVMSYSLGQRTREFGIRSALGAQRRDILRLVLIGGVKPSIIGMAVGLAAAFALARLVESQLFEVKVHDPWVFFASLCLLGIVAVLSVYFPGLRAAKLDPIKVLRNQ